MADWDEITKAYRDRAREVYDGDILFIDPKDMHGDPNHDYEVFKAAFAEQYPHEDMSRADDPYTSSGIKKILAKIYDVGPIAVRLGDEGCIIVELDEGFSTKEKIISALSRIPEEELKPLPGDDLDYVRHIAAHEAAHCGDERVTVQNLFKTHHLADVLYVETIGDFIADMYAKNSGKEDVSRAWLDARASAAGLDAGHATHLVLDHLYGKVDYHKSAQAAAYFLDRICSHIMAELGFEDVSELVELEKDNPELFMDVVDNLVLQGKFDDDPEIKKAVQDFSRAKRALIDFDKAGNGYEDHNLAVEKAADAYLETQKTAVLDPSVPLPPKF